MFLDRHIQSRFFRLALEIAIFAAILCPLLLFFGCGGSSGGDSNAPTPIPPVRPAHTKNVIGYWAGWSGGAYSPSLGLNDIQWDKLTHVNYAFLTVNAGKANFLDSMTASQASELKHLVEAGHAAGAKVFISVGGGANRDPDTWSPMTSLVITTPSRRTTLVNAICGFVTQYDLDGIDLDYEGPGAEDAENCEAFVTSLHDALAAKKKDFSITVFHESKEGWTDAAIQKADWVNFMAYDDWGRWSHSHFSLATRAMNAATGTADGQWGLDPSRVVLGLPFYGWRAQNGSCFGNDSWDFHDPYAEEIGYSYIAAQDASGNDYTTVGEGTECVSVDTYDPYAEYPWLATGTWYNGVSTIQQKCLLAQERNCAGVMFWTLNTDAKKSTGYSLLSAIDGVFAQTVSVKANLALYGTGVTWSGMTTPTSVEGANRQMPYIFYHGEDWGASEVYGLDGVLALNDVDLITDFACSGGASADTFEAAGFLWENPCTISQVSFLQGTATGNGTTSLGFFDDSTFPLAVQISTDDGTTWTNVPGSWDTAYPFTAAASESTYSFTATVPIPNCDGVRIVGRIHNAGNKWVLKEIQVFSE